MPSETILGRKHAFTKSIGKRKEKHTFFDPKMAPKCPKMAPRWFQEPSWPLLVALGPLLGGSWPLLAALGSLLVRLGPIWEPLEAMLGRLGAILGRLGGILVRSGAPEREGWRRSSREAGPPLETYCVVFFLQGT